MYISWSFNTYNHRSDSTHAISTTIAHTLPARTAAYDTRNAQVTLIRVEREGILFLHRY